MSVETDGLVPIYVRVDPAFKARMLVQCKRLYLSQSALMKQALSKFMEEEEQIQAYRETREQPKGDM